MGAAQKEMGVEERGRKEEGKGGLGKEKEREGGGNRGWKGREREEEMKK